MSITNNNKRYWIWGEFDKDSHQVLKDIQLNVNEKLKGPEFDLHLTLSGPFYTINRDIIKRVENFSIKNKQLPIKINSYQIKDLFFQSLFIEIEDAEDLRYLKNGIDEKLGLISEIFYPHISLFYGVKDRSEKISVINSLPTIPEYLILNKVSIVEIGEYIESWKVLHRFNLAENFYASNTIGRPI